MTIDTIILNLFRLSRNRLTTEIVAVLRIRQNTVAAVVVIASRTTAATTIGRNTDTAAATIIGQTMDTAAITIGRSMGMDVITIDRNTGMAAATAIGKANARPTLADATVFAVDAGGFLTLAFGVNIR